MNLDVEQLLTIDVDSEIRKLAEAELGGSWQIPAELVRRAVRAGAKTVDVELDRGGARIADDGEAIDPDTARALAALLDVRQSPPVRHRALLELEAKGEVGLVALAGLEASGLRVVSGGAEVLRTGTPARRDVYRNCTAIELDGVDVDFKQAKKWLAVALRFAPVSVMVNGALVERGMDDAIADAPLESPLEGTVALLRTEQAGRVWLLRWGVVTTHTQLPGGFAVEAALEVRDRANGKVGAGELRDALKRELAELEAQAIDVAISVASQIAKVDPLDREKVRMLLFSSAKLAASAAVRRVKMLPALYGPTQALEWTSIDQLLHHGAGKSVLAVEHEKKAASAVTHQPIFVLSSSERARLAQLYGISFAPPPTGVSGGPGLSVRGLAEKSARVARAAAGMMAGAWQKSVAVESLTGEERAALEVFREAAREGGKRAAFTDVEICDGEGPAFVRRKGRKLVLPRANAEVRAAVKVCARDPSWAYPALVALLGGESMPASGTRDAWTRR